MGILHSLDVPQDYKSLETKSGESKTTSTLLYAYIEDEFHAGVLGISRSSLSTGAAEVKIVKRRGGHD